MAKGVEIIGRFKPGNNVPVYAAGANINGGHFVTISGRRSTTTSDNAYIGAHTGAGLRTDGVSQRDAIADVTDHRGGTELMTGGIARVIAGAAIDASSAAVAVKSDATGRAIPQASSGVIIGYAYTSATAAGQVVDVKLLNT